jgi:phosphatidylinositol alpha-mannosyltransferase
VRIALVCPYDLAQPGGVQQQVIELADRLVDLGHDAWAVGPGTGEGWQSVGPSVGVRANSSRAPIAPAPRVIRRVRRVIAGADVVHVHEPLMPMTSLAALSAGFPTVATFHAAAPAWVRSIYRLAGPVVGRWLRRTEITAVSPVAAAAIPAGWGLPTIIPNGIDVGAFHRDAVSRLPHRVAFLGRDEPRKGLDVLLEAWPSVRAAVPDAELEVLGAARSSSIPGVSFRGRVGEPAKHQALASAAVFSAPNLGGESFGIVVAEGMAAGCAVVASDLPAFRAVAGDGADYVAVGDPGALANAIVGLLRDERRRAALAALGRDRSAQFDWASVTQAYLAVYRRATSVS